jgi:hypothetical protein
MSQGSPSPAIEMESMGVDGGGEFAGQPPAIPPSPSGRPSRVEAKRTFPALMQHIGESPTVQRRGTRRVQERHLRTLAPRSPAVQLFGPQLRPACRLADATNASFPFNTSGRSQTHCYTPTWRKWARSSSDHRSHGSRGSSTAPIWASAARERMHGVCSGLPISVLGR